VLKAGERFKAKVMLRSLLIELLRFFFILLFSLPPSASALQLFSAETGLLAFFFRLGPWACFSEICNNSGAFSRL